MPVNRAVKVLHFTEAGGGVTSVISQLVKTNPSVDHTIFLRKRQNFTDLTELRFPNSKVIVWDGNIFIGFFKLLRMSKQEKYTFIHLHSSYAGLARIFTFKAQVIYSPHCFAFERRDISKFFYHLIRFIEKVLTRRTDFYLLVSLREGDLLRKLKNSAKFAVYKPRVPFWLASKPRRKFIVVGRICPQKNPQELVQFLNEYPKLKSSAEFIWIGDGESELKEELIRSGVHVTGWLSNSEVLFAMADCLAIIHMALWEGYPVIFAEAAAGGIPVFIKSAPYSENFTEFRIFQSLEELNQLCEKSLTSLSRDVIQNSPCNDNFTSFNFYQSLLMKRVQQ